MRLLSLSTLAKAAKRCACNPSASNEAFLNALIEPYVEAGRVLARGGREFRLDKHRTSKILNGEADVPVALRNVRLQHGLERRVAAECEVLWDETLNPLYFRELAEEILGLADEAERKQLLLKEELESSLEDPCLFIARALIGVMGLGNKSQNKGLVWKKGTGSLGWAVCDLFRFGFGPRRKIKNLVVIPVDCSFETHVTRAYEGLDVKRVSANTVHGKWLTRMSQSGISEAELKERLSYELEGVEKEADGSYPIGTVAAVETDKCVFLLLAISKFDCNGNAHSTPQDISNAIDSLFRHYDRLGQAADLYMPLLGTGLSRTGMSSAESFRMIEDAVIGGSSFIGGKVTIALLPEAAHELGLTR